MGLGSMGMSDSEARLGPLALMLYSPELHPV